jgi:hypothetical protein
VVDQAVEGESTFQMHPLHMACSLQHSTDVRVVAKEKHSRSVLVHTL